MTDHQPASIDAPELDQARPNIAIHTWSGLVDLSRAAFHAKAADILKRTGHRTLRDALAAGGA